MVDGNSEIFFNVKVGLEFLRILESKLKDIIEKLDSVLPILLDGVVLVHFLEFAVVRCKIFASHDFVEDDLLKLMVFYLNP